MVPSGAETTSGSSSWPQPEGPARSVEQDSLVLAKKVTGLELDEAEVWLGAAARGAGRACPARGLAAPPVTVSRVGLSTSGGSRPGSPAQASAEAARTISTTTETPNFRMSTSRLCRTSYGRG